MYNLELRTWEKLFSHDFCIFHTVFKFCRQSEPKNLNQTLIMRNSGSINIEADSSIKMLNVF